jgi:hypothetical protein
LDGRRLRGEILVSAMPMIHEARSIPDDRLPLYSSFGHKFARTAGGFFLAFMSVGFVGAAVTFREPTTRDLLVGPAMILGVAFFSKMMFRSKAIYGSPRGLEYQERGRWRTIPWQIVGSPEYTFLRSGIFYYEAWVEIAGEKPSTIWFYATRDQLDEFQRMRDAGLAGRGPLLRGEILVSAATIDVGPGHTISDDRQSLHATHVHKIVRGVVGALFAFYSVAVVLGVVMTMQTPSTTLVVAMLVKVVLLVTMARLVFLPKAIFGSARGLEYRKAGQWLTIPWANVGSPEYSRVWRLAIYFQLARVAIAGEKPRTIWFYATRASLDAFRQMRDAGAAKNG